MPTLLATVLSLAALGADDRPTVVVVLGTPGSPDYEAEFRRWADLWRDAATRAGAESIRIGDGQDEPPADRDRLRSALAERGGPGLGPLWLVLIGHGSSDGREAKFNLRGPDLTEAELADWLAPVKRPVAVLDCSSSSGPFLTRLSAEGRVVVAATRSGNESNYARFGQHLAEAIADPRADLDKDGQVSLLEAYLAAAARTEEFYRSKSRLATEHALIDDNGDKLGTPADWFRGVRAIQRAKDGAAADGLRAHQWHLIPSDRERSIPPEVRRDRDRIELAIAALRDEKTKLPEDAYYARLEALMVELARLYDGQTRGRKAATGP
jgi:hypothetical protein